MSQPPDGAGAGALAPDRHRVTDAYDRLTGAGQLTPDPAQRHVAGALDVVLDGLADAALAAKSSSLGWLFGRRKAVPVPRGLYVWGGVGRGKTMLMDLFFERAPVERKERLHFHAFMARMHDRVAAARSAMAAGDDRDPIEIVAAGLAREVRLVCFDEFSVTDIADAMLLGRLFARLFDAGVVLVATSNVEPDRLYEGGLNRGSFLPFVDLLKRRCAVVHLGSETDYRLDGFGTGDVYLVPPGRTADDAMARLWCTVTGSPHGQPRTLSIKGRTIEVPEARGRAARFGFEDLCMRPLGAADYRLVAAEFDTVFLAGVPQLSRERRNEAKRFITLIDTLYDEGVKLVVSAAAEPDRLYAGHSGTEAFEFARTASRLVEMRSDAYRAAPRRDHRPPVAGDAGPEGSDEAPAAS